MVPGVPILISRGVSATAGVPRHPPVDRIAETAIQS